MTTLPPAFVIDLISGLFYREDDVFCGIGPHRCGRYAGPVELLGQGMGQQRMGIDQHGSWRCKLAIESHRDVFPSGLIGVRPRDHADLPSLLAPDEAVWVGPQASLGYAYPCRRACYPASSKLMIRTETSLCFVPHRTCELRKE